MTKCIEPEYTYFQCREHGYFRESACFPGTVGVTVTVGTKTHRFCPYCYLELLRRECFELKAVLPTDEVKAHFSNKTDY